jgi:ankyrin repeat protein
MKNIKSYNNYINESLKDKLKGKSKDDIIKTIKGLPPQEQFEKACKYNVLPIIKELIKHKDVDPSIDNNSPIGWLSYFGNLEVVKELLKDNRVNPSDWDNYAINVASLNGHIEVVKELLKYNSVNASNLDTAIDFAKKSNHNEIVRLLNMY